MPNQRLKIGLVFDDSLDTNDGVQQYVRAIGRYMMRQGHEVRFLVGETHSAGPDIQPHVRSLSRNVSVRGNQNKMFLPVFARSKHIQAVLDQEQFDVLHVMTPFHPVMAQRVVNRSPNIAKVSQFHMVGSTWFINLGAKLLALIQRRALRSFDVYLGVSQAAKEYAKAYFGLSLTVSPNPVDIAPFRRGKDQSFLRGKTATIVFLGRLVERKGAWHLLAAIRLLHQQGALEGVRVNICGDGEQRQELEDFVITHNLGNVVFFHGYLQESEKADYLASADIAVYPSVGGEAFGIVLVEAMATGRPVVIGGDNAGYRTVLGEYSELLFQPNDHQGLANKIMHFLHDQKARTQALAWQNEAVKQYDLAVVGKSVEKHYYQAIKHRRSS